MNKHTPGPWFTSQPNEGGGTLIKPIPGQVVAQCDESENMEANAKHIVDCVNACEGLPDGCLDGGWTALGASAYAKHLETTNAELLEALERLLISYQHLKEFVYPKSDSEKLAEAAIAKAKGEQP